jgi:hypothetical protein
MTGGLLQLVAKGPEDIYLINKPEITLFKIIYRRHVNFAMYPFKLNFNKKLNFGNIGRCKIKKNADLVNKLTLIVKVPEIKMDYPVLTKKALQTILTNYSIVWYVPNLDINLAVTKDDYDAIKILSNNKIIELQNNKIIQQNRKYIIEYQYINSNINISGRDYANNVFPFLMAGEQYEIIYAYLDSYKKDLITPYDSVYNFDDINIAFFNKLVAKLVIQNTSYPFLDINMIFYLVIEFANYIFNQSVLNYNMKYIFDKALEFGYVKNKLEYSNDSYIVYNKYFNQLSGIRTLITSQNDINTTLKELLADIQGNFRKNILQLINIVSVLQYNNFDNATQFRISIYKRFKFITSNVYNGTEPMNILTNTTNIILNDYLSTNILKNINDSSDIRNYFGSFVNSAIQLFTSNIRAAFRINILQSYFADNKIWERLKLSTFDASFATLDSSYIMNTIPYYAANDIPLMVNKYILLDTNLSQYAPNFDLTSFVATLQTAIDDMYTAYKASSTGVNIFTYLTELDTVYRSGTDKLLVALFKPEIILSIDISNYTQEVVTAVNLLELSFNGNAILNINNLLPIEYIIHNYIYKYVNLIYSFTSDTILRLKLIDLIIINIVNKFRTPIFNPSNSSIILLPSYDSYKNNNFSFFEINSGTIQTTVSTSPLFLDAASSIWYYINQSMVTAFNTLYRNSLMSPNIYQTTLGDSAKLSLDAFKTILVNKHIIVDANDANYDSIDFYKLRLDTSDYTGLISFYTNKYNAFSAMFDKYQNDKNMFKIKNASFNKSKNYYRSFDDIFNIIKNEILQSTYTPINFSNTPQPSIIVAEIHDDLFGENYMGVIDIKDQVRINLDNAITNAITLSNPYQNGTNLHSWFEMYKLNVNSLLLTQFDFILSILNADNSITQYTNENISNIYGNLINTDFVLSYMMDSIISKSGLNIYINSIANINKITTYNNFLKIVNNAISLITPILQNISISDSSGSITQVFDGSIVSKIITKFINNAIPPFAWVKELGHKIIKKIHVEIGGQVIEEHTGQWYKTYHNIYGTSEQERGYNIMIGNVPELYKFQVLKQTVTGNSKDGYTMYIPLIFWFNNHYCESLPLIAMKYTDIDIVVQLSELNEVSIWDKTAKFIKKPKLECSLLANYVYVDSDERKRLATTKHEYLIEVLQSNGEIVFGKNNLDINGTSLNVQAFFSNCSKFITGYLKFIKIRSDDENNATKITADFLTNAVKGSQSYLSDFGLNISDADNFEWLNDTVIINGKLINPIINMKIKFNGHDRENIQEFSYYQLVQPNNYNCGSFPKNNFMYNFGINPKELQPSGAVNMMKINDFTILFYLHELVIAEIIAGRMKVSVGLNSYSYNWLRIMSGMAALSFYG